ncbi:hypothetical protein E1287_41635 [Actinomadura sp. KC06]|uniref:protein phosphatase 2C domain-containing protein n=1 Tax=Actinomadura sp. KC06 TaxID=2530369 RepID=UPI001043668C|nr:protein phosphatase 2C domain-containing protein [Actinomadura sp. KC06]TDD20055.1 hypothetical protein E1287_41635 [Actinomadura sp. KC06]
MSSDRRPGPESPDDDSWRRHTDEAVSVTEETPPVTAPPGAGRQAAGDVPRPLMRWVPPPEPPVQPVRVDDEAVPPPSGEAVFAPPPEYRRPHPKGGVARRLPRLPEAVADTVLDGADFDGLTVRAASLRGDDHRYLTEPRQDTAALWPLTLDGTDALLCCVADGLGSQPNSHLGSALACRLLREETGRGAGLWDDPAAAAQDVLGRVVSGMLADARTRGIGAETLSTTLVAAVVELTPPDRPRRGVVLRVGDSTAYMLRDGLFLECFEDAHKDEAVQGSGTNALPGNPGAVEVGAVLLGNDDVLVLCTDGLSNPMHNDEVKAQLVKWWSTGPVPGILEFGWQLAFRAKSYGDDRSAICVWGR